MISKVGGENHHLPSFQSRKGLPGDGFFSPQYSPGEVVPSMISSPTEKQQKNTEGFVETKIAKAKGFLNDFFPSNWIGSGIRKMAWDPQKKRKPKKMFDPDFQ